MGFHSRSVRERRPGIAIGAWLGRLLLALAALVVFSAESVAAEPRSVKARIEWGGSVCGDAEGFTARVSKRSRAVRFVESGEQVRVSLSIRPEGNALGARAKLEGKGRPPLERHIESPDCDDALDALALVVAISLEAWPTATPRPPARPKPRRPIPKPAPKPAPEPQPEPPAAAVEQAPPADSGGPPPSELPVSEPRAPASPAPDLSAAEPPALEPPAPEPRAPAPPASVPGEAEPAVSASPPRDTSAPSAWRLPDEGFYLQAALFGGALFGVTPEAMPGAGVALRARWEARSVFSPELALAYAHHRRAGLRELEGEAAFALDTGTLELCPLALGPAYVLLRPCVGAAFGALTATGRQTFGASRVRRPWVAAGAGLSAVARWARFDLRASAGLSHPFVRDAFRFASEECVELGCPANQFDRVEPLLWSGAVSIGIDLN